MALLKFLSANHDVTAAFFHHGTETSEKALKFLSAYADENRIKFTWEGIREIQQKGLSPEEHWRQERYKFLESLDGTVVTAHHLDDVMETWVWSSLHGTPKLIPYQRNNVVRPFLAVRKQELIEFCQKQAVYWIEDETNADTRYARNLIRKELMPVALKVNPGLDTMLRKKILQRQQESV